MATGSCLDDGRYGPRGYACNGSVFQKWNVHKWADSAQAVGRARSLRPVSPRGDHRGGDPCAVAESVLALRHDPHRTEPGIDSVGKVHARLDP